MTEQSTPSSSSASTEKQVVAAAKSTTSSTTTTATTTVATSQEASLTSKLIEMILNYETSNNKRKASEPLVSRVAKFIKQNKSLAAAEPASYLNQVDVVSSHGIEVDRPLTPLMAACMINDVDLVCFLLKNGARLTETATSYGFELAYAILRPKNLTAKLRKNRNVLINIIIDLMEQDPNVI